MFPSWKTHHFLCFNDKIYVNKQAKIILWQTSRTDIIFWDTSRCRIPAYYTFAMRNSMANWQPGNWIPLASTATVAG